MTVVRSAGLWSLANAFVRPVRPARDEDLVGRSISALDAYWGRLRAMYDTDTSEVRAVHVATIEQGALDALTPNVVPSVATVIQRTVGACFAAVAGA